MASRTQLTIQNAVFLFAELESPDRKRLLPNTRRFMKSQDVRRFTPQIVEGARLQKSIKKDIRQSSASVEDRLDDLKNLYDRATEAMDVRRLRRCVDSIVYLAETFYFEYKVFKIIVMGFYQMNPQMMARYKCLKFSWGAEQVIELGVSLWDFLQNNRDEEGFETLIARFERKADAFGASLCQHCRGRVDDDKAWWYISLESSHDFYAVWKDLERAIHGEVSIREVRESLASLAPNLATAPDNVGQSHSAPSSPVSRPRRRIIHKRHNDSFDSYLNGHAF